MKAKIAGAYGLMSLFALEAVFFYAVIGRHNAWVYPRWFDQLQYLREAYRGYEQLQAAGFSAAAGEIVAHPAAQGSLHGLLFLASACLFGPSRMAALAVNMAAFLLLQGATYAAVRWMSRSTSCAWASVAFLIALQFPWSQAPGSMVDFRLDWIGACAFGIALAAAVRSDGFRSWPLSVCFGLAAGAAILVRFISAAYFGLIFAVLLAWLLCRPHRRRQCLSLLLAGAAALAVAAPALWRSRGVILDYYWVAQITGPEHVLRAKNLGLTESLEWFLTQILEVQVGWGGVALAATALAGLGALGAGAGRAGRPDERARDTWAVALAFFAAPAAVLLVHPVKDGQHLSILAPALAWMFALVWARLERGAPRVGAALAAAAVAGSLVLAASVEVRQPRPQAVEREFREINGLGDYIFFRSEQAGLAAPRVGVTSNVEMLYPGVFELLGFERHRRLLPVVVTLPTGLAAPQRSAVLRGLEDSDFVLLVTQGSAGFPFDETTRAMLPELREWCDAHLRHVGDLQEARFSASLFERRSLPNAGLGTVLDLGAFVRAASQQGCATRGEPPSPPVLLSARDLLASTLEAFDYEVRGAFGPVRFAARDLPLGLEFDARRGRIAGRFERAGTYALHVAATNPTGTTDETIRVRVEEAPSFSVLEAPSRCRSGEAIEIAYGALDIAGKLDFVEFTDLTQGKSLGRIAAAPDQKGHWLGSLKIAFERPGRREILCRTVRYDERANPAYSFVDKVCAIEVVP